MARPLRRFVRYPTLYPDLGIWHTSRRDTGAFIGFFALNYAGKTTDIEIGYRLLRNAWGQGFATEGATALAHYGFDDLGLHRIIGVTHPGNQASQRVLMKAGLADVGWGHYYDRRLRLFAAERGGAMTPTVRQALAQSGLVPVDAQDPAGARRWTAIARGSPRTRMRR